MAHADVKHDYHLVNPSPWPLFGSVSASFAVAATGLGALVVADAEAAASRLWQLAARADSHVL